MNQMTMCNVYVFLVKPNYTETSHNSPAHQQGAFQSLLAHCFGFTAPVPPLNLFPAEDGSKKEQREKREREKRAN